MCCFYTMYMYMNYVLWDNLHVYDVDSRLIAQALVSGKKKIYLDTIFWLT